jgi:hypothetical protein
VVIELVGGVIAGEARMGGVGAMLMILGGGCSWLGGELGLGVMSIEGDC